MSTASPRRQSADEKQRLTLSREVGELLLELSIGLRRYAIYPPEHPALGPLAESVTARLADCFEGRGELAVGVAQTQLIIDGLATEAGHPVLSDLARRLHDHEIGVLVFRKGISAREVRELLQVLATDPEEGVPVGQIPEEGQPGRDHLTVHPVGYRKLRLRDRGGELAEGADPAILLWLGLVQAALGADEPPGLEDAPEGDVLAETIRSRRGEEEYDKVIVGYLLQLAEEQKGREGEGAEGIRGRISELIRELDEETLERLLELGGDSERLRRFVLDANQGLAADAVMKLLQAAAASSGQTISHAMTRMLTKLSMHARSGPDRLRAGADTALRDHVEELIENWDLEDPNPHDYTETLDAIARAEPEFDLHGEGEPDERELAGPDRLVQTALEVDAFGPSVRVAASALAEKGDIARLLDLVEGAPPGSEAAEEVRGYLSRPDRLRALLAGEEVDADALHALIDWMGAAAVDPLLDALVESEVRAVRRKVFEVLSRMEDGVTRAVMERLEDERWYVVRNMLALIKRWEEAPDGFDPMEYVDHADARVRREAFPLALQRPEIRTRALAAGLADSDDRLVRLSLLDLRQRGLSDALLPTLVNRVVRGEHSEDLRALAVRALEGTDSPLARDALVELADGGRSLLGSQKVADPSRPVLAALEVLRSTWPEDGRARKILDAARRSRAPEIRSAAEGSD